MSAPLINVVKNSVVMKSIDIVDLGVIEYGAALTKQQEHFNHLIKERSGEVLLYCEHPHVYTLGKHGGMANLLISDSELERIGATFYQTDRGGDITYHGYGQLVGYPIIDIQQHGIGLRDYIYRLEEAIIQTIAEYGITGYRVDSATGVWVMSPHGERKISAIGVKASRYVTMHGFALNVNTDLRYFDYINPCGFKEKGVTSIAQEVGSEIDMAQVKERFSRNFMAQFFVD